MVPKLDTTVVDDVVRQKHGSLESGIETYSVLSMEIQGALNKSISIIIFAAWEVIHPQHLNSEALWHPRHSEWLRFTVGAYSALEREALEDLIAYPRTGGKSRAVLPFSVIPYTACSDPGLFTYVQSHP